MHALTQRRTRLERGRQRLIGAALAIGIVTSAVLVPLSATATDEVASGGFAARAEQLSDELTASEAEIWKLHQQELAYAAAHQQERAYAAAKEERLERLQAQIAIANGVDPDDAHRHLADVVLREKLQLDQAQATADAYANDGVYTLYDADAVLASAMPSTTQQNVLRMIAPDVLLTILYGRPGSAFM